MKMMLKVLSALSLNLQTAYADHYGVPHDLAYDYEDEEDLVIETVQEIEENLSD